MPGWWRAWAPGVFAAPELKAHRGPVKHRQAGPARQTPAELSTMMPIIPIMPRNAHIRDPDTQTPRHPDNQPSLALRPPPLPLPLWLNQSFFPMRLPTWPTQIWAHADAYKLWTATPAISTSWLRISLSLWFTLELWKTPCLIWAGQQNGLQLPRHRPICVAYGRTVPWHPCLHSMSIMGYGYRYSPAWGRARQQPFWMSGCLVTDHLDIYQIPPLCPCGRWPVTSSHSHVPRV